MDEEQLQQDLARSQQQLSQDLDELGSVIALFENGLKKRNFKVRAVVVLTEGTLAWTKGDDSQGWGLYWETGTPPAVRRTSLHKSPVSARIEASFQLEKLLWSLVDGTQLKRNEVLGATSIVRALIKSLGSEEP